MAWTYDITTDIGKVRLITGDNVATDPVFTDEEVQYFLTEHGTVKLAAAALLEAWAAQYAANVDSEKIGDYQYAQKVSDKMLALARRLREEDAMIPTLTWATFDLTGEEESES